MTYTEHRLHLQSLADWADAKNWLSQFEQSDRAAATSMLLGLTFIPMSRISEWIRSQFTAGNAESMAVYVVSDVKDTGLEGWGTRGVLPNRPAQSVGSDDFIHTVVTQLTRANNTRLLDHPSVAEMRSKRCHAITLIDDSINSGARVSGFLRAFFAQASLMSWWSMGIMSLRIISYARNREAEDLIMSAIPGSDHPRRKHKKREKVSLRSCVVYTASNLEDRWGPRHASIVDLAEKYGKRAGIPRNLRLGYGSTMSTILFEHSVPNNLPGILHRSGPNWSALFPGRTASQSAIVAFKRSAASERAISFAAHQFPPQLLSQLLDVLTLVARGVRSDATLSFRLAIDLSGVRDLLFHLRQLGYVTQGDRPTPMGSKFLRESTKTNQTPTWNRGLYLPQSWRTDQGSLSRHLR